MKKILSLLAIVLGCLWIAGTASAAENNGKAEIKFTKTTHDFGTIKEKDGPVECEFEFENVGDGPLVILSATAGCGCTTPTYPNNPIKPGEKGSIKVKYNPAGHPGEFNRSVKVRSNAKSSKKALNIVGTVVPSTKK